MAGVKGKSGGAREGAGRPPKQPVIVPATNSKEPLQFLLNVMNDGEVPLDLRIKAASTAAQYVHAKKGDSGKKEERQKAAERAAALYAPIDPPKLKVVGSR